MPRVHHERRLPPSRKRAKHRILGQKQSWRGKGLRHVCVRIHRRQLAARAHSRTTKVHTTSAAPPPFATSRKLRRLPFNGALTWRVILFKDELDLLLPSGAAGVRRLAKEERVCLEVQLQLVLEGVVVNGLHRIPVGQGAVCERARDLKRQWCVEMGGVLAHRDSPATPHPRRTKPGSRPKIAHTPPGRPEAPPGWHCQCSIDQQSSCRPHPCHLPASCPQPARAASAKRYFIPSFPPQTRLHRSQAHVASPHRWEDVFGGIIASIPSLDLVRAQVQHHRVHLICSTRSNTIRRMAENAADQGSDAPRTSTVHGPRALGECSRGRVPGRWPSSRAAGSLHAQSN